MSVLVLGDIILDEYWKGNSRRLSPESPVAITNIDHIHYKLGGAANVAEGLAALEVKTKLVGVTGDDEASLKLQELLTQKKIQHQIFKDPHRPTIRKVRVHSGTHYMARMDFEEAFTSESLQPFFETPIDESCDYLVLSDYNKGSLSKPQNIINWAQKNSTVKILVDPKKNFENYKGAWLIKPNKIEFQKYVGEFKTHRELEALAQACLQKNNFTYMLVTLGSEGMMLISLKDSFFVPSENVSVFDVTGAGDTVMASLAGFLDKKMEISLAIKKASAAAALAVSKLGTYCVSLQDLKSS